MKIQKKIIAINVLFLCMAVGLFALFLVNHVEVHKSIKKVQEPYFDEKTIGFIKSEDINSRGIGLVSGDVPVDVDVYIDANLQFYVDAMESRECFQCAVGFYDKSVVKVQKKDTILEFPLTENCYYVNGVKIEDGRHLTMREDKPYLPMGVLTEQLMCNYTWDAKKNTIVLEDQWTDSITPSRYNLQEVGRDTVIKNQGTLGTCWAVASLSALETSLKPEEHLIFATDHMSIRNSFAMTQNDGGEYTMAMAYLLGWQGPVSAEDDPYGDEQSPEGLEAIKHVQEVQIFKEKDIDKVKQAVFFYGAVQSSIYTSLRSEKSRSSYYNRKEAAYCYTGNAKQNHEVIIIGWDDNYPKENFNARVEGDGAFICQNSWGTEFGKDGVFYISYYDTHIGSQGVVYTKVEDTDNYDRLYQTDLCGWAGQLGYNSDTAYFANAFTAEGEEVVSAVGFYATDKDTSYEVYFVPEFYDVMSLDSRVMVASGKLKEAGFYTIPIESEQLIQEGQKFAVVIKITTPLSVHPVAVEYAADETTKHVDLTDGEGYISMYGTQWSNVETEQKCNVCMKVYTKEQ